MATVTYDKEITGLLVLDPYNDFISEGGKLWDRIRDVAEANDCVPHMLQVLNAARQAKLRVFIPTSAQLCALAQSHPSRRQRRLVSRLSSKRAQVRVDLTASSCIWDGISSVFLAEILRGQGRW